MINVIKLFLSAISLMVMILTMSMSWVIVDNDTWMSLWGESVKGTYSHWAQSVQPGKCVDLNPLYVALALLGCTVNLVQLVILLIRKKLSALRIAIIDLSALLPWILYLALFPNLCVASWSSEYGGSTTDTAKAAIAPVILMVSLLMFRIINPP